MNNNFVKVQMEDKLFRDKEYTEEFDEEVEAKNRNKLAPDKGNHLHYENQSNEKIEFEGKTDEYENIYDSSGTPHQLFYNEMDKFKKESSNSVPAGHYDKGH